ncbi:MAG: arginine--tRNA ligase, partial [Patescibacteria group bacterium]|nr:arginine--tRNA ligase [Patescibacteria group bacterium]
AASSGFGQSNVSSDHVLIEYISPNTHKELHVGHLRNLALGLAAVNLRRTIGEKVTPVTYVGDIGAHVAKCLWALRKFHGGEAALPEKGAGRFLGHVYTDATQRVEENPDYKLEIAEVQKKLEARDPDWDRLWLDTRDRCLNELRQTFAEMGATFERWYLESEVEQPGKELVKKMLADGLAEIGEGGAIIINLEADNLGVFLLLKSDGNSLYSTKELALAGLKFREYPETKRSLHIVDVRQSQYFRQLFRTLEKLGFDKEMMHLDYEFVTLKEGAMSSRLGNIVTYEDFRDAMVKRVTVETKERHADWPEEKVKAIAWAIAEGAMKFGMLKQDPDKVIVFDMEAALSFDGFTGPYVQYAGARLNSILTKARAQRDWNEADLNNPRIVAVEPAEYAALLKAAELPEVVRRAALQYKPSILAQYLFDLAQAVSAFYRDVPVLNVEDRPLRNQRLGTAIACRNALSIGLRLLGIQAPEEM